MNCSGALLWLGSLALALSSQMSRAQAPACLADIKNASQGPHPYMPRGNRCEGILNRNVHNLNVIAIVGVHAGDVIVRGEALRLGALTSEADVGALTIRAMAVTSTGHYQMDALLPAPPAEFNWPADVITRASADPAVKLDLNALGILACTNRCLNHPETQYLPVRLLGGSGTAQPLTVLVRSDVRSRVTRAHLRLLPDGQRVNLAGVGTVIASNLLSRIELPPGLSPGRYRLELAARDTQDESDLVPLVTVIHVSR